ncbi:TEA/ATTS domain family-domain-containing protein [Lipomyces japonicus]|uniref:TEA/ATTS domain family-domain-containing protein n=1 Tax=Lipomyces japonicus TaxID=56871 RepID=UPI0034CE4F1B
MIARRRSLPGNDGDDKRRVSYNHDEEFPEVHPAKRQRTTFTAQGTAGCDHTIGHSIDWHDQDQQQILAEFTPTRPLSSMKTIQSSTTNLSSPTKRPGLNRSMSANAANLTAYHHQYQQQLQQQYPSFPISPDQLVRHNNMIGLPYAVMPGEGLSNQTATPTPASTTIASSNAGTGPSPSIMQRSYSTPAFMTTPCSRKYLESPAYNAYLAKQQREFDTEGIAVWSQDVEDAFMEAIHKIPKVGRRKITVNGRPCGRNELISDFIFRKTGKVRTRKQVSSHTQVLKHLLKDDIEFINLVSDSPSPVSPKPMPQPLLFTSPNNGTSHSSASSASSLTSSSSSSSSSSLLSSSLILPSRARHSLSAPTIPAQPQFHKPSPLSPSLSSSDRLLATTPVSTTNSHRFIDETPQSIQQRTRNSGRDKKHHQHNHHHQVKQQQPQQQQRPQLKSQMNLANNPVRVHQQIPSSPTRKVEMSSPTPKHIVMTAGYLSSMSSADASATSENVMFNQTESFISSPPPLTHSQSAPSFMFQRMNSGFMPLSVNTTSAILNNRQQIQSSATGNHNNDSYNDSNGSVASTTYVTDLPGQNLTAYWVECDPIADPTAAQLYSPDNLEMEIW